MSIIIIIWDIIFTVIFLILRSFFTVWLNKQQDKETGLKRAFIANLIWVIILIVSFIILTFVSASIISILLPGGVDLDVLGPIFYHLFNILAYLFNFFIGIYIMSVFFKHNLFENAITVICIIISERALVYIINGIVILLSGFFLSNGIYLFWNV